MTIAITGSSETLQRTLADVLERRGHRLGVVDAGEVEDSVTTMIRIGFDPLHADRTDVAAMSGTEWLDRVEAPLRAALAFHQVAARHLARSGGRIVVVLPTTGLTGARGAVALSTAAEAERSLVKSQARALGAHGVTVNCVAVSSSLLAGDPIDRAGLQADSLPAPTFDEVAAVIEALIDPRLGSVTGQTIAVDAGRWTAP